MIRERNERYTKPDRFKIDYLDDGCEEIEGCKLDDVGWMRVGHQCVLVEMYAKFREREDWQVYYRRPGAVILGDLGEGVF